MYYLKKIKKSTTLFIFVNCTLFHGLIPGMREIVETGNGGMYLEISVLLFYSEIYKGDPTNLLLKFHCYVLDNPVHTINGQSQCADDSNHSRTILFFFFRSCDGVLKMTEIDITVTRHRA